MKREYVTWFSIDVKTHPLRQRLVILIKRLANGAGVSQTQRPERVELYRPISRVVYSHVPPWIDGSSVLCDA